MESNPNNLTPSEYVILLALRKGKKTEKEIKAYYRSLMNFKIMPETLEGAKKKLKRQKLVRIVGNQAGSYLKLTTAGELCL